MHIGYKNSQYTLTVSVNDLNTIRSAVHDSAVRAETKSLTYPITKATRKEKAAAKREAKRIMDLVNRLELAIRKWQDMSNNIR